MQRVEQTNKIVEKFGSVKENYNSTNTTPSPSYLIGLTGSNCAVVTPDTIKLPSNCSCIGNSIWTKINNKYRCQLFL